MNGCNYTKIWYNRDMAEVTWTVTVIGQARKAKKNLSIDAQKKLVVLIEELKRGPQRQAWPNYGKLGTDTYHCHIKKGRPTYVVCWTV